MIHRWLRIFHINIERESHSWRWNLSRKMSIKACKGELFNIQTNFPHFWYTFNGIFDINYFSRSVILVPEEPEDMWHAYNLISEDDYVRSTTIRKVQNETATGSSSSSRVRTTLTICVESIDFDTQACVLRLKGRNREENQYVKVIGFWPKNKIVQLFRFISVFL